MEKLTKTFSSGEVLTLTHMNDIKNKVNDLVDALNEIDSAVSSAQSTANNATTAANNAQSTANSAKTDASTAQTAAQNAADSASSAAASASAASSYMAALQTAMQNLTDGQAVSAQVAENTVSLTEHTKILYPYIHVARNESTNKDEYIKCDIKKGDSIKATLNRVMAYGNWLSLCKSNGDGTYNEFQVIFTSSDFTVNSDEQYEKIVTATGDADYIYMYSRDAAHTIDVYVRSIDNVILGAVKKVSALSSAIDELSATILKEFGVTSDVVKVNAGSAAASIMKLSMKGGHKYQLNYNLTSASNGLLYVGLYDEDTSTYLTSSTSLPSGKSSVSLTFEPTEDYENIRVYLSNYSSVAYSCSVKVKELSAGASVLDEYGRDVASIMAKLSCSSLNENSITRSKVTFLHFSDLHGDKTALKYINDFRQKYSAYIDDTISSGDQIEQKIVDDFSYWDDSCKDILLCLGNHEVWKSFSTQENDIATEQACFEKYFTKSSNWNAQYRSNKCYYYKDYSLAKVRLIVLDMLHISSEQITWLTNTLANAKANDMTVITMAHFCLGDYTKFQFNYETGFTAFEHGESWNWSSTTEGRKQLETILKSYIDDGGKYAIHLCGHTHGDYFGHSEKGIPTLIIEQAGSSRAGYECRTAGTSSQFSFNIMTIDPTNTKLYVARIGNTLDLSMRRKEFLCFDYEEKKLYSNG